MCAVCEELTALPGSNAIKAGAFARELKWRIDRSAGGWICPKCDFKLTDYLSALRRTREEASEQLADFRARRSERVGVVVSR